MAGELAEDLLAGGEGPVVVQQVQQRQRHREHAQGQVGQSHVAQQHVTGRGQPLKSDDIMNIVNTRENTIIFLRIFGVFLDYTRFDCS